MPRTEDRARLKTPLQREIAAALESRNVRVTGALLSDIVRAFERQYELAPIRNVKRNAEVVSMEVRSRSDHRLWYRVRMSGTLSLDNYCNCEAALRGHLCWHMRYAWKISQFLTEAGLL